ncbi:hypothetical protein EDB85DRAFT_1888802 [Lactarius pseudohatsudake]|nr:hypothetical protein EDB85DRAFT_1888802 [Lactarius pseudohatsudake]
MGRRGRGSENGCGELDIFKGVRDMGGAMGMGCRWTKGTRGAGTRGLRTRAGKRLAKGIGVDSGPWGREVRAKEMLSEERERERERETSRDLVASAASEVFMLTPKLEWVGEKCLDEIRNCDSRNGEAEREVDGGGSGARKQ